MSRAYAKAAVAALKADSTIAGWATGGILDRDPRRSGPNQTTDAFQETPDGDIKPTIAIVGTTAVRAFTRVPGAMADSVVVRLFAPDFHTEYDGMDMVADRVIRILNRYRAGNSKPGIFQFEMRLGMQNGGAFDGVVYDHITFNINSVYARLEVTV